MVQSAGLLRGLEQDTESSCVSVSTSVKQAVTVLTVQGNYEDKVFGTVLESCGVPYYHYYSI